MAEFAARLADILNAGALNTALGLGYRTGLLETMDRLGHPATCAEIADAAGCAERYVHEWLGVMVCGGIVALTETDGAELFELPREHGDVLCRRAGPDDLGVYTQEIPLLARCAWDEVLDGMRSGEGVAAERYPVFHEFMGQLADAKHRRTLVPEFLPSVDNGLIVERLNAGIRVLDLGCGRGLAALLMAQAFPASSFVGVDIVAASIEHARAEAARLRLTNVEFLERDAAALGDDPALCGSFDYITAFDAIHDQTRPRQALAAVHALLKPGGAFSMIDIAAGSSLAANQAHPMGTFLYTVSLLHCMPVGLHDGGAGLGMLWGREKAVELLRGAGFTNVDVQKIPHDAFNLHFFCYKK